LDSAIVRRICPVVRAKKTDHPGAGSWSALDQRISGGTKTKRSFRFIDQTDRCRAENLFSLCQWAGLDHERSHRVAFAPAHRALFAGNVERVAGRTIARERGCKRSPRIARPGDAGTSLCQWVAHFGID